MKRSTAKITMGLTIMQNGFSYNGLRRFTVHVLVKILEQQFTSDCFSNLITQKKQGLVILFFDCVQVPLSYQSFYIANQH